MKKVGIEPKDIKVDEKKDPEFKIEDAKPKNRGGRPQKNFDDLNRKVQVRELKPLLKMAKETAKKRKISVRKGFCYISQTLTQYFQCYQLFSFCQCIPQCGNFGISLSLR